MLLTLVDIRIFYYIFFVGEGLVVFCQFLSNLLHFHTFGGHFEYIMFTEAMKVTYCKVQSITLTEKDHQEILSHSLS